MFLFCCPPDRGTSPSTMALTPVNSWFSVALLETAAEGRSQVADYWRCPVCWKIPQRTPSGGILLHQSGTSDCSHIIWITRVKRRYEGLTGEPAIGSQILWRFAECGYILQWELFGDVMSWFQCSKETWWHIPEIQNACAIEFAPWSATTKNLASELYWVWFLGWSSIIV